MNDGADGTDRTDGTDGADGTEGPGLAMDRPAASSWPY